MLKWVVIEGLRFGTRRRSQQKEQKKCDRINEMTLHDLLPCLGNERNLPFASAGIGSLLIPKIFVLGQTPPSLWGSMQKPQQRTAASIVPPASQKFAGAWVHQRIHYKKIDQIPFNISNVAQSQNHVNNYYKFLNCSRNGQKGCERQWVVGSWQ